MTILLLLALILACSIGPGFFLIRRLRWEPDEKFCAAIAVSLAFIYLGSFSIYAFKAPEQSYWILTIVCVAMTILSRHGLLRLFRATSVKRMLAVYGSLWLGVFLLLSLIRSYGGGRWSGDWVEHFQRSCFFIEPSDLNFRFLNLYLLTERPPLMNLIAGHFMAQTQHSFEIYEIVAATLNLLPAIPLCLFVHSMTPVKHRNSPAPYIALLTILACSPMFMQNVTYVWTKSFATFFAIFALWLYVRGWMKHDSSRTIAAFICATAGCLVHYSIVPYLLVITLHYLFVTRHRLREVLTIGISCALLLSTWFGWAIYHYGFHGTFMSNLTISGATHSSRATLFISKAQNLYLTLVPFFLRSPPYADLHQADIAGKVRDLAFSLYQLNAIFALGSVGAILLAYIFLTPKSRWKRLPNRIRRFWLIYAPATAIIAICTVPGVEKWGAAQIGLLPLVLVGLALIAASFPKLPTPWRTLLLTGLSLDFALGILLHVHLENRPGQIVVVQNGAHTPTGSVALLSQAAQNNLDEKYDELGRQWIYFWAESVDGASVLFELILCGAFAGIVWKMRKPLI